MKSDQGFFSAHLLADFKTPLSTESKCILFLIFFGKNSDIPIAGLFKLDMEANGQLLKL